MESLRIWYKQRVGKPLTEDEAAFVQHKTHLALANAICKFILSQSHAAGTKWWHLKDQCVYDLSMLTYYTESLLQHYDVALHYENAYAGRYIVIDYTRSK